MQNGLLDPANQFTRLVEHGEMVASEESPPVDSAPRMSPVDSAPRRSPVDLAQQSVTHDSIIIHLFMQDRRLSVSRRLAADLEVPSTAARKGNGDHTFISASQVFSKLQRSLSAIEGEYDLELPGYISFIECISSACSYILSSLSRRKLYSAYLQVGCRQARRLHF